MKKMKGTFTNLCLLCIKEPYFASSPVTQTIVSSSNDRNDSNLIFAFAYVYAHVKWVFGIIMFVMD